MLISKKLKRGKKKAEPLLFTAPVPVSDHWSGALKA